MRPWEVPSIGGTPAAAVSSPPSVHLSPASAGGSAGGAGSKPPPAPLPAPRRGPKPCASGGLCPPATDRSERLCWWPSPAAYTTLPASGQAWPEAAQPREGRGRWESFIGLGHVGCGGRGGGWRHGCPQAPQKVFQVHLHAWRCYGSPGTISSGHSSSTASAPGGLGSPSPSRACVQRGASAWLTAAVCCCAQAPSKPLMPSSHCSVTDMGAPLCPRVNIKV